MDNITDILRDNYQNYYWIGFIFADGCISNNTLTIALSIKDISHLNKFGDRFSVKIKTGTRSTNFKKDFHYCELICSNKELVTNISDKFDFRKGKTYNPPKFNIINDDLFFSLICGFIDGDGNIRKLRGRKDCNLRIKIHSSWLDNLILFENFLYSYCNIKHDKQLSKINSKGYAELCISNNTLIRKIKTKALKLKLPLMKRKWDNIDCNLVSRYECVKKNKEKIIPLFKSGMTVTQIYKKLKLTYIKVYWILKRENLI